jgi:repressor LexA
MTDPLTRQQERVLTFIRDFVERHRFAPTAREIGERFGIAEKNGFYYLALLERKGHLRRLRHHPRRIELLGEPPRHATVRVPVLGSVPAGNPREAVELQEDELLLDAALVGEGELFSLRVSGDSMTGDHITDGDYVIVRCQPDASDGDIVVAVVAGDATIKRFRRRGDGVVLEASNPAYPSIPVPADTPSFRVAGKVVGVYRKI